jgi:ligand-binding sensor domain-containing protein/two-component sensor histidine kinase
LLANSTKIQFLKKPVFKYLLILLLIPFLGTVLFAQNLSFAKKIKQFTIDNGLPNNNITALVQDNYGFIWVGTSSGLCRYDGYNFVLYTNIIGDTNSISSNGISSLCVDKNGFMWVTTSNGLNRYNFATQKFTHYRHNENNNNSIANNNTQFVYEDKAGTIWVAAYQTLDKLDIKTGNFTHYLPPSKKVKHENLQIEGIIEFDNDIFVSVWGDGVYRFNKNSKQFIPTKISRAIPRESNWIHDFYVDDKGNLLAAEGMLLRYNKSHNTFYSEDLKNTYLNYAEMNCIAQLPDKNFVAGSSRQGMYLYDTQLNLENKHYITVDNIANKNLVINKILPTKSGEVWIATSGHGMFEWDTNLKQFDSYTYELSNKDNVLQDALSQIYCSPQGKLLLAYRQKGAAIFDVEKNKFTNILYKANGLNIPYTFSIFQDKQGNQWVGTWGGGLNKIDAKTGKFSYYLREGTDSNHLQDNFVSAIRQATDNKIWVATTRGVSVINNETNIPSIKSFVFDINNKNGPPGLRIDDLLCSVDGSIWIGTNANGLSHFDPARQSFINYEYDFSNTHSISNNKITCLYEDSKKQLWIGTGGGVNLFVPTKNNFIHYTEKEGLISNEVRGIVADTKGILWITTNKGISKFDVHKKEFTNYNTDDGLVSNQFSRQSIIVNPIDGKIYAGCEKGLIMFHPDSIVNNKHIPPVYITSFKKYISKNNNTTIEFVNGIEHIKSIELKYYENTFTVDFVALNYNNSNKNKYAYKLQGLNNNWITLGTNREVTFSNLASGNYTLQIKASNSDGVWNEKGISLHIKILPPWWRTWWAYLLYALCIIGLVYGFIKLRINITIQKIKAQQLLRTKISSDLHDDVGTILSGLAMQSQMLTYTAKEEQKESLIEISTMSHDAMERMRDTVWAMDSRKDKFENLVDRMRDFAEKNLQLKKITHEFIVENVEGKKFIDPEKRQAIYLIFKEAITNIIKHSDGKHVAIHFTEEKHHILLIIHDDGTTKPPSHSDGLGMSNMKMRAEKMGGILTAKYDDGFVVELVI